MRRFALVMSALLLLAAPAAAPAAHEDCAVTATPLKGASPLQVTFTATCASSAYTWSFGDSEQGLGASVTHVYAAGLWQPTLATDTGTQTLPPVTAVSLTLRGPVEARYAEWVTLRATVTPKLPIAVRGRHVIGGRVRFRALSTAPYVAFADGVRSQPVHVALIPKLTVRGSRVALVGQPVRVVATLHPAQAGTVHVPLVDTRTAHVAHLAVTTTAAPGWRPVSTSVQVTVVHPTLGVGSAGGSVLALQSALAAQHYLMPPRSSTFSTELTDAIYAFQKVNRISRTGIADLATWRALGTPVAARPRYAQPSFHIEIDKELQVLFAVRNGAVAQIVPVSTAGLPGRFTPVGKFAVYRKVLGFDPSPLGTLYDPSYFTGGYAIHGNPSVPPYPASHGCVRVPMWAAPTLYDEMPYGTVVYVY